MLVPVEKINEAQEKYGANIIPEVIEHFGIDNYNENTQSGSCPFHSDKTPSFIWNPKENSFHCFSCGRNFGALDLYLDQGKTYLEAVQTLFEKAKVEYNFSKKGTQTKTTYKYPTREDNHNRDSVEKYLELRFISKKTLDYTDIQSDIHNNIVFHFYDSNDVLLSVKYRPGRKIQDGEPKCWFQKNADNTPLLFNMNKIDPKKPLVITEGEIDCLSVIEAGWNNVVSVPNGSSSMQWIEHNWDWLEQFETIILWSDNDEAGLKMRSNVVKRLGSWRTYYIEVSKDELILESPYGHNDSHIGKSAKDANDVLIYFGAEKVLEYIKNPIEMPIEGVLDLADAEDFDIESVEGLVTGLKPLDDKLYKLIFGTVNIVTGKPGEGKSVFVNQIAICQALQQGYDTFVFSGELPAPNLKDWVETNLIGREKITMKNDAVRVFDRESREIMREWYRGRIMLYDDSIDTTATSLLNKMEEMARKFGTKVFLIDNLMMVDLECSDSDRLQAEKQFIKNLILFAKRFGVLVFLVAHPRKTSELMVTKEDVSGSSNIVNLAHTVFSVHRYTDKERMGTTTNSGKYLKGQEPKNADTVISVLKNRITGALPTVDVNFDCPSYRFYTRPEELWFRYKWNKDQTPLKTEDPNERIRELKMQGETPL